MSEARRVVVISLGGTIASVPSGSGGAEPTLDAADQLAAVGSVAESGVDVTAVALRSVPSASLTWPDLAALAAEIEARAAAGIDGVVVTQGTDTIEETAFFLDIAVAADVPVVVTGAMRHAGAVGADGPANLLAAVRVAASPAVCGFGCVVVFADEVHAAQYVHKGHTTSIGAFGSPGFGPCGWVVEDRVAVGWRPRRHEKVAALVSGSLSHRDRPWPRVPVLAMGLGGDDEAVRALRGRVDALVVAGMGAGHVPAGVADTLGALAGEVPVVIASRTGSGPMLTATYGSKGAELDLAARGLIGAGFLDPFKARILLTALVAAGADRSTLVDAFAGY